MFQGFLTARPAAPIPVPNRSLWRQCDFVCEEQYKPVCAVDETGVMQTFSDRCIFELANCVSTRCEWTVSIIRIAVCFTYFETLSFGSSFRNLCAQNPTAHPLWSSHSLSSKRRSHLMPKLCASAWHGVHNVARYCKAIHRYREGLWVSLLFNWTFHTHNQSILVPWNDVHTM